MWTKNDCNVKFAFPNNNRNCKRYVRRRKCQFVSSSRRNNIMKYILAQNDNFTTIIKLECSVHGSTVTFVYTFTFVEIQWHVLEKLKKPFFLPRSPFSWRTTQTWHLYTVRAPAARTPTDRVRYLPLMLLVFFLLLCSYLRTSVDLKYCSL